MNILRGRGNGRNIKIICNWNGQDYLRPTVLLFRWNDENWYNFTWGYVFTRRSETIYVSMPDSWRDASRIPKDYILSLRDPLHQGYRGVNINLVELNVDDRKELLLHVSTRTSLCKISQANEFIYTNIGTDNSHILIR